MEQDATARNNLLEGRAKAAGSSVRLVVDEARAGADSSLFRFWLEAGSFASLLLRTEERLAYVFCVAARVEAFECEHVIACGHL